MIASIAGAAGHQLLAIDEGVVEIGIAAAAIRDSIVDAAASIQTRLAGRAERAARLGRAHAGVRRHREEVSVAAAHAESASWAAIGTLLLRIDRIADSCKRIGKSADIGRRAGRFDDMAQAAENLFENALCRRRCGQCEREQAEAEDANHRTFATNNHRKTLLFPHAAWRLHDSTSMQAEGCA